LAGFVAALGDAHISRALARIHLEPAQAWGLDNLAEIAGLSRSAFATRFNRLVGMPPKSYLTMWRMQKARSLLRNPYTLLAQIAEQVGYASDVALIRAFQRHFGASPKQMRRQLAVELSA
jgi:AraC family transcriptional activator of mtrCDE